MHRSKMRSLIDYLVGSGEQRRSYSYAERLGSFEIDDEFELDWLLYRQFSWIRSLQDFVHVTGGTMIQIWIAGAICDQPTGFNELLRHINCGYSILCG